MPSFKGPVKKLHASSTTTTDFGTWTTQCTQCHDVHFQGQLDWAADASLYLATGTIAADNAAYNTVSKSTSVAINAPVANPLGSGWDDTTKWTTKGGNVVVGAATTDGTRGLIFVPNKNNPTETFEIIAATPTSVTVKGKMTTALSGNAYGVIYGQSLKSYVLPNNGTTVNDLRAVKFFKPEVVNGTYGGYVDESANLKPEGLCQVCHTHPLMVWKKDGTANTHHVGEKCGTCHNGAAGFPPAKNHSEFMIDGTTYPCVGCHATKVANPESGHVGGCTVCHTATKPEINDTIMATEPGGSNGSSLDKLVAASYSGGTTGSRLLDASSRDINNVSFTKIKCDVCHVSRAAFHAGHTDATFGWAGNCSDCHSGTGVVANVHSDSCILCHVNADGTGGRKIGDATNGIDGHANGEFSTATCLDCHDDNTPGTIHHNRATADNCATSCHKVSTTGGTTPANHAGNHTALVNTDANCVTCHASNEGSANGAPVDGSVTPNMIHDKCTSCHNTTGVLKTAVEVGGTKVTAMPNGGVGSTNGGGACGACHGVYFTSHDHSHAATVTSVALCGSCHTGNTISDALTHVNNCAGCHNTTTGARIGSATASPTGGVCTACHTAYFTGHSHNHIFSATAACATCHGNNVVGSNAKDAVADPYATAGEVHGVAGCAACHNLGNNTGALYGSATGKAAATECISCHVDNWTVTHTGATGLLHTEGRVGATAGSCDTCHGAPTPGTSDARDAQTTPYIGTGEVHGTGSCATCHTGANNGGLKTGPLTHAETVAKGTCTTCHTNANWTAVHASAAVNHNVSAVANCTIVCHGANTSISSANIIINTHGNNCAACHNTSNGARIGSATASPSGGNCSACHTAYFTGHQHNHGFTADAACSGCHGNPSSGSGRTAKTAPFIGTGEVHSALDCATCHDTTPATYGQLLTLAVGKLNNATCVSCHGAVWQTIHAAATVSHNASVVGVDAACNSCHATNAVAGSNARKLGTTSPYMAASGDIHYTAGCATCHNSDGSMRSSGLTKADRVGAGGTCTYCHANTSTWTTIHTAKSGVSHATRVDALATCTTTCHTATAGGASGLMPVSAGDNKVHDSCAVCHTAAGALIVGSTTYGGQTIAKGTCGTCHTAAYFDSHVHGSNTAGYVTHDLTHNSTTDLSQNPGQPCLNCHNGNNADGNGVALNSWLDIKSEHLNLCSTCHSYTNGDGLSTPPLTTNNNTIASGTAVKCLTCHTEKAAIATHGGHSADFGTTASCVTTCHTGASVLNNIHDGATVDGAADCAMCHSGGYSKSTVISGSATNGVDGDARMAYDSGVPNFAGKTCVTCHTPGATIPANGGPGSGTVNAINATSTGGIHHDNKSANVTCTTAGCHTASKLTHTTSVTAVTLCTDCHNGATAGGAATGATTVPYIAAGQVHTTNGCTTCHLIAVAPGKAGGLVATTAKSLGIANGGTNTWVTGTDGGGSCTTCHSSVNTTYGFLHHDLLEARGNNCTATCHTASFGIANHSGTVINAVTTGTVYTGGCVTCHTSANIVGTTTGIPVNPASGLVHDGCFDCHTFDANNYGILVTIPSVRKGLPAAALPNGGTIGGTNGGGSCVICHTGMNTKTISASVHHSDSAGHTNIGECEYCHADPRPTSASASETNTGNFNETAASGWITPPKHLPCEDCHVTPKSTGIATGTNWANPMTILAFNAAFDTQKSMSTWAADYTRSTANTGGHSIANSSGKINNWGICFNCHDNTRAIKVAVLHPAPILFKATNAAASSSWGTFLPGRSMSSTLANFNFLAASYRPTSTQPGLAGANGSSWAGQWATGVKYNAQPYDGGTASDMTIPDPYSTASTVVPMYPARTAESTITPVADSIQVTAAMYDVSADSLTVTATTSAAACNTYTLTANYRATGPGGAITLTGALTGTKPNCTITWSAVATNPTIGTSIVDVATANTEGFNVSNVYIMSQP